MLCAADGTMPLSQPFPAPHVSARTPRRRSVYFKKVCYTPGYTHLWYLASLILAC